MSRSAPHTQIQHPAQGRNPREQLLSNVVVFAILVGVAVTFTPYMVRLLDGYPAAYLASKRVIPESWASASVRSVCALLDVKEAPTPMISLSAGAVTDVGAEVLGAAMLATGKHAQTRTVALLNNYRLSADGVASFCQAALRPTSPVEELDLSGNPQLSDAVVEVLAPYISETTVTHRQLREVRFVQCGLSTKGAEILGGVASTSVLRTLDLSLNALAGAGAALGALADAPLLEELILSRCGLGDEDVAAIARELPDSHLRSLEMSGNAATESGVAALADHLAKASLVNLSLANNRISASNALGRLANAWAAQPARRNILDLAGNPLSEAALRAFEELVVSLAA